MRSEERVKETVELQLQVTTLITTVSVGEPSQ